MSGIRCAQYMEVIFVVGGYNTMNGTQQTLDTVHIIYPQTGTILLSRHRLSLPLSATAAVVVEDAIYVFGGVTDKNYGNETDKWMKYTMLSLHFALHVTRVDCYLYTDL